MTPLLSVVLTAYRHERFLAQAIESILEQTTPFDFEIVIGVDASEDRSAEIARGFRSAHPERIRVLEQSQRVGLFRNFAQTYSLTRGRYIALLEGDDYWVSPVKLARQIAHLEANPDVRLSGHTTLRVDINGKICGRIPGLDHPELLDSDSFLEGFCELHTSCLVFPEAFARALPLFSLTKGHGRSISLSNSCSEVGAT